MNKEEIINETFLELKREFEKKGEIRIFPVLFNNEVIITGKMKVKFENLEGSGIKSEISGKLIYFIKSENRFVIKGIFPEISLTDKVCIVFRENLLPRTFAEALKGVAYLMTEYIIR